MSPEPKRRKVAGESFSTTTTTTTTMQDVVTFVFPFLAMIDATNLGRTSVKMKRAVKELRPDICIIQENCIPTKMGFKNDTVEYEEPLIVVHQIQKFRFLLDTPEGVRRFDLTLSNSIWEERRNRHLGSYHPSSTKVDFLIFKGDRDATFVFHWDWGADRGYCQCNKKGCFYCAGFRVVGLEKTEEEGPFEIPAEFEDQVRASVSCYWACAKRVASFPDGTEYPSAAYLMRQLHTILHPFFPEDFDWDAPYRLGRKTKVEFAYRPAPTLGEWYDFIPPSFDGIYDYFLDEIPWYADDSWQDVSEY